MAVASPPAASRPELNRWCAARKLRSIDLTALPCKVVHCSLLTKYYYPRIFHLDFESIARGFGVGAIERFERVFLARREHRPPSRSLAFTEADLVLGAGRCRRARQIAACVGALGARREMPRANSSGASAPAETRKRGTGVPAFPRRSPGRLRPLLRAISAGPWASTCR